MAIMKSLNGNDVCDAVARGMTAVTTSGNNNAYTATVDGITSLTSGFNIVITPNVTATSAEPTLNVNSIGAYPIRQRISSSGGGTTALGSANMIMANKPVRVMYIANGIGSGKHCWVIDDMVKADVTYATGILPPESGGTGCESLEDLKTAIGFTGEGGVVPIAAGGTNASTAAQARANLGVAASSHVHSAADITSGTLSVARGGTGATDAATARNNLGAAASSHEHSAADITSGTLAVARGGTGKATHTSNAVLTGNGTSAVNNVATASGAFYATSANGAPSFGTLPVAQGGTGATAAATALNNLGIKWGTDNPPSGYAEGTIYLQYS